MRGSINPANDAPDASPVHERDHARHHQPRKNRHGVDPAREEGDNKRAILDLLRKAARFDPASLDIHMALGNLYAELDLKLNARREFELVLQAKKDHAEAKEALKKLK